MPAHVTASSAGFSFQCAQCGEYSISTEADAFLRDRPFQAPQVGIVSGWLRKHVGATILAKDLDRLRELRAPNVFEKAANLLLEFASESTALGIGVRHPVPRVFAALEKVNQHVNATVYPDGILSDEEQRGLKWLALASATYAKEVQWLIEDFLKSSSFVREGRKYPYGHRAYPELIVTPEGWREIHRLQVTDSGSRLGFVAMSFRPEFNELYERGIAPAITAAGYEPFRVDRKEHNNRIDDEIIASIKRSRFLVGDFTVDRGGIYFEAGYAAGLALPVIWLVREDSLDSVHFDNRQYNFIRWTENGWAELNRALRLRIEATVGRGPGVLA